MESWIRRTQFVGGKRAWIAMDCGGAIGDAARFSRAPCRDKGWECMGTAQIRMPENCVALLGVPSVEEARGTIAASEPYVAWALRKVRHGERLDEPGWPPLAKPVPYNPPVIGKGIVAKPAPRFFVTRASVMDLEGKALAGGDIHYVHLDPQKISADAMVHGETHCLIEDGVKVIKIGQ